MFNETCPLLNETKPCNVDDCLHVGLPMLPAALQGQVMRSTTPNETFSKGVIDNETWCAPDPARAAPYTFETKSPDAMGIGGGIFFSGTAMDKGTVRSRMSFQPDKGLHIEMTVDKSHHCSNHYVVLSTKEYFRWTGPAAAEPDAIKFVWSCDTREIVAIPGVQAVRADGEVPSSGSESELRTFGVDAAVSGDGAGSESAAGSKVPKKVSVPNQTEVGSQANTVIQNGANGPNIVFIETLDGRRSTRVSGSESSGSGSSGSGSNAAQLGPSCHCPKMGKYKMVIDVDTHGRISFGDEDERCETLKFNASSVLGNGAAVFLFIGAAQEPPKAGADPTASLPEPARFEDVMVSGLGSVANEFNLNNACPLVEDCEVGMAFRYKASGQAARQRAIEQRNFTERARKQLAERREIDGAKTRVQREHVAREHGLARALWARERAEAAAQVRVHGTASREAAREVLGGLERMGWAFTAVSQL